MARQARLGVTDCGLWALGFGALDLLGGKEGIGYDEERIQRYIITSVPKSPQPAHSERERGRERETPLEYPIGKP